MFTLSCKPKTCLAASNQPQNTEDSCTRNFVILAATVGAMGWTE